MERGPQKLRPIWLDRDTGTVKVIDQRKLPHQLAIAGLETVDDVISAIREMFVRGAPLIGITGAYGVYLAAREGPATGFHRHMEREGERLKKARPTAVNLVWAVQRVMDRVRTAQDRRQCVARARREADAIYVQEAGRCRQIGMHGLALIQRISRRKDGGTVNVLTHCNAGWLACGEYGTATAPVYAAVEKHIDVHVWVDETRPLNQGIRLTAWELGRVGVPHTIVADNAGGHLMQHGLVDLVIVGSDRATYTGDVANKIGTYLKALAARDNQIPFYVALPSSTFDWKLKDGIRDIPIEERDPDEVRFVQGLDGNQTRQVLIGPEHSPAVNFAFDVTAARLVTGFITERGICKANEKDIRRLFRSP